MAHLQPLTADIKITDLTKTFPGRQQPSVKGVNLHIQAGDFLCLLGPSGCGKTTTLRTIAGLEQPSSGRIEIGSTVVDDVAQGRHVRAEDRGLGFVFQNYALWPHMTVEDNVGFGPLMQRTPKRERAHKVREVLEKLDISEHADRYPSALSGGQQQRVAIARTLAAQPAVMLLDEPLSNLDARLRLEMRAEFQRIHRESGTTMVFVTHDQFEAMTLATRIAVMDKGELQQVGTPLEIYHQPKNRFVAEFIGSPPINIIESSADHVTSQALSAWAERRDLVVASAGIRPEALQLASSRAGLPEDALQLELTVSALLPTGSNWIIELTDGHQRLFATTHVLPEFNTGDRVIGWASTRQLHLFDEQDQAIVPTKVKV